MKSQNFGLPRTILGLRKDQVSQRAQRSVEADGIPNATDARGAIWIVGIFPYIGLKHIGQKYMVGTSNQSVPEMAIESM